MGGLAVRLYLLTVENSYQFGAQLQILPRVPLSSLVERAKDLLGPQPGEGLELRLPDGSVRQATIGSFGIEGWRRGDGIYTANDPSDPVFTLNIAGDLQPNNVPAGTQVWLAEAKFKSQASSAG
jgi:hypothetical protein